MILRINLDGRTLWLKQHDGGRRRVLLAALGLVARALRMPYLRPPRRGAANVARHIEQHRLRELAERGVRVPDVLSSGNGFLVLSDMGSSMAAELAKATTSRRDQLIEAAAYELTYVHACGSYVGQPLPRNMTLRRTEIGFIDLEEDPGEVMPIAQAQTRDWLLFAVGYAHHAANPAWFSSLLARTLASRPDIANELARAARRLWPLEFVCRRMGSRSRRIALSLLSLRQLSSASSLDARATRAAIGRSSR